jgi:hypothetical protein
VSDQESDYQMRCKDARATKAGDVWRHRKTGKLVTVRWRVSLFRVALIHESGKQTVKQDHYLAGDYELVTSS